jgi:hypothetical protein
MAILLITISLFMNLRSNQLSSKIPTDPTINVKRIKIKEQ